MFHHFQGQGHSEAQGSVSADQLVRMIEFLERSRILPAEEWMQRALAGKLRDDDLCLTFDDGLLCQYDVAYPVLKDFGLTGFWFVYTAVMEGGLEPLEIYRKFRCTCFESIAEFYAAFFEALRNTSYADSVDPSLAGCDVAAYLKDFPFYSMEDRRFRLVRDRILDTEVYNAIMEQMIIKAGVSRRELAQGLWMTYDCLRRLRSDGHIVGLHSHTHPIRIELLQADQQEWEYVTNRNCLCKEIGEPLQTMAHPCNSYNISTLDILRRLGIRLGFISNMAREQSTEYEWPREDHTNVLKEMCSASHGIH